MGNIHAIGSKRNPIQSFDELMYIKQENHNNYYIMNISNPTIDFFMDKCICFKHTHENTTFVDIYVTQECWDEMMGNENENEN